MNEKIPVDCIFCGSKARVVHYDSNLYYCMCSNTNCKKTDKFGCMGRTANNAIDQWNFINRPMNRTPSPKKKKKDEGNNI